MAKTAMDNSHFIKLLMKHLFIALILFAGLPAFAGTIEIKDPWIRAVPATMENTAAYLTVINHGTKTIRLLGVATSFAKSAEPMITTRRQESGTEVVGMKTVDYIEIPAGQEVKLEPGGDHLMLMGLTKPLKAGEKTILLLKFGPDPQELKIEVVIR